MRLRVPNVRIPRLPDASQPDVFEEMSLYEHLDELRSRIVKACISIGAAFVIGVILADRIFTEIAIKANVLVGEDGSGLDISKPTDSLTIYFKIAMYVAIGIAMPMITYQAIAFLSPGLTKKEKRILFASLPFVSLLFVTGVSYAFFFAVPRAFDFLSSFQSDVINWDPDASEVVNFYLTLMIGLGVSFQLPVVMFLLAKLNIVSPRKMSQYRRYAFLGILVASAIITPSTDPINMAVVAVPLVILYEGGIIIARVFAKSGVNRGEAAPAV